MSETVFAEADEVVRFGNPWHGYRSAIGGALKTDAGQVITGPVTSELPVDGWNRFTDFGAPAVSTSSADSGVGMTWLNKAVWVGYYKLIAAVHSPGPDTPKIGQLGWPYKAPDGSVWWLFAEVSSAGNLVIYANQAPMNSGAGATSAASVAVNKAQWDASVSWVNFAPDGSKATIHSATEDSLHGLSVIGAWECAVTGGSATTPPTVTLAASGEDFSEQHSQTVVYRDGGYPTFTSQDVSTLYNGYDYGTYPEITYTGVYAGGNITTTPGGNFTEDTTEEWSQVVAIVYSTSGQRQVLSTKRTRVIEERFLFISASGTGAAIGALADNFILYPDGNYCVSDSVELVHETSLRFTDQVELCINGSAVETVITDGVVDVTTLTATGISGGGNTLVSVASPSNYGTHPFAFIGPVRAFLANGETLAFAMYDPPCSIISYVNSRHHNQFVPSAMPAIATFNDFSTHPLTGVFDPSKDRYF